jgi:hypothetical protein
MCSISLVLLAVSVFAGFDPVRAEELTPTRIYQVGMPFRDGKGQVASNVSGFACMAAVAERSVVDGLAVEICSCSPPRFASAMG